MHYSLDGKNEGKKFSLQFIHSPGSQEATKRISASVHKFDAPFLILHGLEDKITCPKVSEEFFKDSPSTDKSIKLYEGEILLVSFESYLFVSELNPHLCISQECITVSLVARLTIMLRLYSIMQFHGLIKGSSFMSCPVRDLSI